MRFDTLSRFQVIITAIDSLSHELEKHLEIYKCKISLIDGSNLRIFEKYDHEQLVYYSYYWLTAFNQLIIGWDCAPHHFAIDTFPYHKHVASHTQVSSSMVRNLNDALMIIKKGLLSRISD
jgi:hypothetical protein